RGIPDPFPPLRDGQSAGATASPPSGPRAVKSTGGPRHGPRAAGALTFAVVGARSGGKTTTVINLGACLADVGWKTLIVDLSASSEATTGLGIDAHRVQASIYELLASDSVAIRDVIKGDIRPNLSLLPAKVDLYAADIELVYLDQREYRLKRALDAVKSEY